jgi:hypothetical protein
MNFNFFNTSLHPYLQLSYHLSKNYFRARNEIGLAIFLIQTIYLGLFKNQRSFCFYYLRIEICCTISKQQQLNLNQEEETYIQS